MPQVEFEVSDWEQSKENIQPIKQGRKAEDLSKALSEEQQKNLNFEKHEFEKELRSYSGDDPLDVWYRYALWVEQNYPKGGKDGNLFKLIESCFVTLTSSVSSEKYKSDERYLQLWIKYASLCPCPLEVYAALNSKNMFIEIARFYESWAWEMEQSGNLKKANAIYLDGVQRKAKPIDALEMAYMKFQARVAQKTLEGLSNNDNENSEPESERKAFSALKGKGTKVKAPIERVSTVVGSAGKVLSSAPRVNAMGPSFKIYQDENACAGNPVPAEASLPSGNTFVPQTASSKENVNNPSTWTKNKSKQKTTINVPVENIDRFQKPTFTVHADEGMEEAKSQPKPTEFSGVLSTRKSESDWQVPLFVAEPFNPNVVPQYQKHLVYVGNEEFSFEELRALARKKEEDNRKEEMMQEELKKLRSMLQKKEEMLKEKDDLISSLIQKRTNAVPKEEVKKQTCTKDRLYEDSWVAINKTASFVANATHNNSQDFNESSTKSLLALQPVSDKIPDIILPPKSVISNPPSSSSSFCNTSTKDPPSRSPTVNTKFAKNLVTELFSRSLFSNSVSELKPFLENGEQDDEAKDKVSCSVSSPPLTTEHANENMKQPPHTFTVDDASGKEIQKESKGLINQFSSFPIYSDEDKESVKPVNSFPIYCDGNEDSMKPVNSFPIYCDDKKDEKPQPFQIYINEYNSPEKGTTFPNDENDCNSAAPFKIFCDKENGNENSAPFQIYCDENVNTQGIEKSRSKISLNSKVPESPSKLIYEDQENLPPAGYQVSKVKRATSGILKPSKDILYIPLEEQEKIENEQDEEDIEGIAPFSVSRVPDDFTLKMPKPEDFSKFLSVASTPMPWSLGGASQVSAHGDDNTMTLPHKRISAPSEKLQDLPNGFQSENFRGNKAELLLSPLKNQVFNPPLSQPVNEKGAGMPACTSIKNGLSPIMEASREFKSSTSSSSSNCTTLGTYSNLHGMTQASQFHVGNASKSINISQNKYMSDYGDGDYCGVLHQESSKSGYLADKSRGESMNECSSKKKPKRTEKKNVLETWDNSFDPDKIADMLNNMNYDEGLDNGSKEDAKDSNPKEDLQTFSPLAKSIEYPREIDPFCKVLQNRLLNCLKNAVINRAGFIELTGKLPQIKAKMQINLGKEMYKVKRLKGSGSYAQVFHASTIDPMNVTVMSPSYDDEDDEDEESQMILKVEKPACMWEFYICHELRERLKKENASEEMLNSFMRINRGYFFSQGSILVTQYHKLGTLLDCVNGFKKTGKSVPVILIFYFMSKLMEAVIALHSCHMIHGDLKPDNVILVQEHFGESADYLSTKWVGVKIIDFGRSIDMDLFPRNTTFTRKVSTDGFTICEMRENRPWTYQTDYYGLAAIAHIMLWGSYMNVKKVDSVWKLNGVNYYRYMNKDLWQRFFDKMLNIPSCNELPDLKSILNEFKDNFTVGDQLMKEMKSLQCLLT